MSDRAIVVSECEDYAASSAIYHAAAAHRMLSDWPKLAAECQGKSAEASRMAIFFRLRLLGLSASEAGRAVWWWRYTKEMRHERRGAMSEGAQLSPNFGAPARQT
jgi:hypothetical protein